MRTPLRLAAALMVVMLAAGSGAGGQSGVDAAAARAAFERFTSLAGEWDGKSSAGWTGVNTYTVIARGSAVLGTSKHGAHPGEDEALHVAMDVVSGWAGAVDGGDQFIAGGESVCHSARSTVAGASRLRRRAGMRHATNATASVAVPVKM